MVYNDFVIKIIVRRVAKRFGARFVGDSDDWNVYWTDMALPERLSELKSYQARHATLVMQIISVCV